LSHTPCPRKKRGERKKKKGGRKRERGTDQARERVLIFLSAFLTERGDARKKGKGGGGEKKKEGKGKKRRRLDTGHEKTILDSLRVLAWPSEFYREGKKKKGKGGATRTLRMTIFHMDTEWKPDHD